jgi:hypothetical protein
MPRFYIENNQINDDLSIGDPINIVLEKGNKEEWTLLDNVELLNYCFKEKIKINLELKKELERFDFILIPPLINPMKINFKN